MAVVVRTSRIRGVGALLVAGLLVSACGSPGQSSSVHASPSVSGSAAPPKGGTLSVAYKSDIQTLDPSQGYDVVSWPAERLLFETLITYDDKTNIVPRLATEMPSVSADGLTYTFTIRSGVNFVKGDGTVLREMTADDVIFSFNRLLDPKLKPNPSPVSASFFQLIAGAAQVTGGKATEASGIKRVDDHTVSFTIARADATFLNIMALPFAAIVPKGVAGEDSTAFSTNPVGTGPFVLKSYEKGQRATFVRNPHYWQAGKPYLDGVDFRVGIDAASALQQVQSGSLDLMGDPIPSGSFTSVVKDPLYKDQVKFLDLVATQFLTMDTSAPGSPLSKVEVRRAIQWAIDKENILSIYHGAGRVANCLFPPVMPGYDPTCKPYGYDPDKARSMLATAGYPNGFSTKLYTDTTDPDPTVAQAIQQDLVKIGIKTEIVTQAFDTLVGTMTVPHQAPMIYTGWFQDFPDPSDFYDPILSCATDVAGNFNIAWYCNKQVDTLATKAKGEQDKAQRISDYQQVQKMIMDDSPWVMILHPRQYTVVSKRIRNFSMHPVWLFDLQSYGVAS
jgi:ABC-type transport system substrate-binding protein